MYVDEPDGNKDDLVGSSHDCAEFRGDESTRPLVLSAAGRGIHVRWCEFWLVPWALRSLPCSLRWFGKMVVVCLAISICYWSCSFLLYSVILETPSNSVIFLIMLMLILIQIRILLFGELGRQLCGSTSWFVTGRKVSFSYSLPSKHGTSPPLMLRVVVL